MATVASILATLDLKLIGYSHSSCFTDAEKINALTSGKQKVWAALSAAAKNGGTNWFALEATAVVAIGDREIALPDTVHDVLSVHAEGVNLRPSAFHKQNWREQRQDADAKVAASLTELLWIVTGSNPPVIRIGHELVGALTLTYFYNRTLTSWTATGDDADDVPGPYHEAVANYAAWSLTNGMQDTVAATWWQAWVQDVDLISGSASTRQEQAGVVTPGDFDSE
jgi:hypothetical protein